MKLAFVFVDAIAAYNYAHITNLLRIIFFTHYEKHYQTILLHDYNLNIDTCIEKENYYYY